MTDKTRWLVFYALCLGVLMVVLDTTIVNVALPSIKDGLGFNQADLVWVINAYMLCFGGLLLLGGRLGDLYGQRRVFLIGLLVFTLASLLCGVAGSQTTLIAARGVQGIGGAILTAVALGLIFNLFPEPVERVKAMGIYGFVCAGGGSIGTMLGGLLTEHMGWHSIFLVNLPIGAFVYFSCAKLLPRDNKPEQPPRLDWAGALTITLSLMLAVYAIVNANEVGWLANQTLSLLVASVVLFAGFLWIESRVSQPLIPLRLFRQRTVAVANLIAVMWAAAVFSWFFLSALLMQLVLGYSATQVGLAFLPANLIMAVFSVGVSARVVIRFGARNSIVFGMSAATAGFILFALSPSSASFLGGVFPPMLLLLGVAAGIAFNPLMLTAMSGVGPHESGVASGAFNTSFTLGGAFGLAILASVAAARSKALLLRGDGDVLALLGGYQQAFGLSAILVFVAGAVALKSLHAIDLATG